MRTEMVSETLVVFEKLTRPIAPENFINIAVKVVGT
jgi:hypothetical protein